MIPDHRYRVTAGYLGALACVLVLGGCTPAPQITGALQPHDHDAIIALEQEYVAGWMAGDPDRVIATFTPDAVLLPHHGFAPCGGTGAMVATGYSALPGHRVHNGRRGDWRKRKTRLYVGQVHSSV